MINHWKKSLLRSVVAATALCAISIAAQAQELAQAQPTRIKVAMANTELAQNAALFAAIKGGTLAEEGLAAEVVYFRSWTEPVQAIASDSAQFALTAASLIRAVAGQNAPVRLVAMLSTRFPYEFVVKKGSGIKTMADLKGKTIQTVRPGETLDNIWRQLLADANMTVSDIKRVESFNGLGSLIAGTVDVANVNDTHIVRVREAGLETFLDYTEWREKKGLGSTAGANLGWGTSTKLMRENPAVVRGFLRALVKANERLIKDREFAYSVLGEKPFGVEKEAQEWVYGRHKDHWIVRMDFSKGDAKFDAEMIEIAMERPKGSIKQSDFAAEEPITGILKELKVTH